MSSALKSLDSFDIWLWHIFAITVLIYHVDILDYLLEIWALEIATNFVDIVDHTILLIVKNPEMFKVPEDDEISRSAFITKHTTMFYRISNGTIEIEYFLGNFENP